MNQSQNGLPPASEHYHRTAAQPIDLLDTELKRGFFVGNVVKYVARYRYKNGIEDLRKDYKCNIYEHRPDICRKFGVVEHPLLKCQYIKK